MPPNGDPRILAFDTSLPHCAAAIFSDVLLAENTVEMGRGQAEHLMPMLENLLQGTGMDWSDLDLIAVGVGPGNFTGIRIAVAAARGLSLGLGIPAMGISMFEVMRDPQGLGAEPAQIISLPAPRDTAYVQHFRSGIPQSKPSQIDPANPPMDIELPANMKVRGFRATAIAKPFHAQADEATLTDVATQIAKIAEYRWINGETAPDRPAPLYVRSADAAPPRDPAPVILP